jgi:hypothetical protein
MNRPKKTKIYRRYADASSKVTRYYAESDSITIDFKDNSSYRWTNQSTSPATITKMKTLAHSGKGLDAFVDTVKDQFLKKIR